MRQLKQITYLLLGACVLVSCGKSDETGKKASTQVVAKVNGDEISIHQVNLQLSRAGNIPESQAKPLAQQVLVKLVDQQLLKQAALEAKLDRDPRILQVLEQSKSELLAQAYLEKIAMQAPKPTEAEMTKFYDEHPELFSARRIFRLQELIIMVAPEKFNEIESNIRSLTDINAVANWLKTNNYPFNANSNVRAAEQLPTALLKQLQPLKDGEFAVLKTARALNVLHIAGSQNDPLSREKAKPMIEQYFLNISKAKLVQDEMAAMKKKAKVEYLGEFAHAAQPKSAAPSPSQLATPTASESENNSVSTLESKQQNVIDKGLSGL